MFGLNTFFLTINIINKLYYETPLRIYKINTNSYITNTNNITVHKQVSFRVKNTDTSKVKVSNKN